MPLNRKAIYERVKDWLHSGKWRDTNFALPASPLTDDWLTGLPSSRAFCRDLEQAIRQNQQVAVAYADMDNFRYTNVTYGYDVGDEVLRDVAEVFVHFCGASRCY